LTNNDKNIGLFANEDLMHSLMNTIVFQIAHSCFATERYTIKTNGKGGYADIVVIKNGIGFMIEMKCENIVTSSIDALKQNKDYAKLIEDTNTQIYLGCNVKKNKEVSFAGSIESKTKKNLSFEYRSVIK
jgi:hypothetical protein